MHLMSMIRWKFCERGNLKPEGHIVGLNGNSIGSAVASHFQLHWANGGVEGYFSEPAKNLHTGG
jgi:hypothetical protein